MFRKSIKCYFCVFILTIIGKKVCEKITNRKIPIKHKYFNIRKRNKTIQEKSLISGIIILKYQRLRDKKLIIAIQLQH